MTWRPGDSDFSKDPLIHDSSHVACPSEDDSLYLGEALERILFLDHTQALPTQAQIDLFEARLVEVCERSPFKDPGEWHSENIRVLSENGRLGDASGLLFESLGDQWFV